MSEPVRFMLDGKEIEAEPGMTILEAAEAAGVYIPRLCHMEGLEPYGGCRVCTVKVNGRPTSSCTQPVEGGIAVESETEEITRWRKTVVEMLFVEGNHFCMFCEKSGCSVWLLPVPRRIAIRSKCRTRSPSEAKPIARMSIRRFGSWLRGTSKRRHWFAVWMFVGSTSPNGWIEPGPAAGSASGRKRHPCAVATEERATSASEARWMDRMADGRGWRARGVRQGLGRDPGRSDTESARNRGGARMPGHNQHSHRGLRDFQERA